MPTARPTDALRGVLIMSLTAILFPVLNAISKFLVPQYPVAEVVWARFAGHLAFVLIVFVSWRGVRILVARRPMLQIGRSFLLLAATSCFISGIGGVPLATASVIAFATPLIVATLSKPLLGEPVDARQWAALIAGFLGVLVVFRPGSAPIGFSGLLIFGSATSYALYQIVSRRIGAHDAAETGIVYAALIGTLATSLVVPFVWETPRNLLDLALFAGIGVLGGIGHYCVTRAFQLAPAAVLSPLGYLELVGATAVGYLVFGTAPDAFTWLGAAIIIGSGLYIARRQTR